MPCGKFARDEIAVAVLLLSHCALSGKRPAATAIAVERTLSVEEKACMGSGSFFAFVIVVAIKADVTARRLD
jgi:hypothetical protein